MSGNSIILGFSVIAILISIAVVIYIFIFKNNKSSSTSTSELITDSNSSTNMVRSTYTNSSHDSSTNYTVRDRLKLTCPIPPDAGEITPEMSDRYNGYLFSACTNANTCDSTGEPDEISKRIINMKKPTESCGFPYLSEDPNQIKIFYDYGTKIWSKLTVKDQLMYECPKYSGYGLLSDGQVSLDNSTPYDDYLFSGCNEYKTCDSTDEPDEISKRILNRNENEEKCGTPIFNKDPNQISIQYDNQTKKWVKINI